MTIDAIKKNYNHNIYELNTKNKYIIFTTSNLPCENLYKKSLNFMWENPHPSTVLQLSIITK